MKWVIFFWLFLVGILNTNAQKVNVVTFSELQKRMKAPAENLTVFNFWATWCGPCVKEIPYFERQNTKHNVKVVLVSLDFVENKNRLEYFVEKKKIKSEVLLLDEKKYSTFLHQVDQNWSGAIPASLFVDKNQNTYFYEKEFSEKELEQTVQKYSQ